MGHCSVPLARACTHPADALVDLGACEMAVGRVVVGLIPLLSFVSFAARNSCAGPEGNGLLEASGMCCCERASASSQATFWTSNLPKHKLKAQGRKSPHCACAQATSRAASWAPETGSAPSSWAMCWTSCSMHQNTSDAMGLIA